MRFSLGVRVAFFMNFSMPLRMARAKYAFGYGSLLGSYVRAAFDKARNPSPSRSSTYRERCHCGRFCTKYLANMWTRSR
jgi:hypothetical protein